MYILKNAFLSIKRNKGRNLLIRIILVVIACACTITLAINHTASDLIATYKNSYNRELSITFNREKMKKDMDFSNQDGIDEAKKNFDAIASYTVSDIQKFSENEHIISYYYTEEISLNGESITKVESTTNDSNSDNHDPKMDKQNNQLDFTFTGYSDSRAMSEFISGKYQMSSLSDDAYDKVFNGNYVFLNEELASYNNLSLGDKITLKDSDENTYEFEIVGIFKKNSDGDDEVSLFSNSANTIITSTTAVELVTLANENVKANLKPTFIIDSYDNQEKIQEDFYQKGLDENYKVETNEEEATSALSGVSNVQTFSTIFFIITLILGGVVLFILNMINIRERKYEIGVLRTIGMSKFKLTMQFASELLIVTLISVLLGLGIGAVSAKGISSSLLQSEITRTNNEEKKLQMNFGGQMPGEGRKNNQSNILRNGPSVSAYQKIDAVVDIKVVLELLGISLGLVFVSSLASMISIQRFSPLTILKERS